MADIGDKLKSAREAKGLSIEDIEKATKIQSRYLTAIEKNEFDKLPGDFYVRAFIRQYAQVVGLDGKELLSDYHEDVPEAKPDEYVENSIDNKSEEVRETTDNKRNLWKNYLPRIAIGLGVIIVILVVYFLYAKISAGGQHNEADNSGVTVSSQKSSSSSKKPEKKIAVNPVKVKKVSDNEYRITGLKKNRRLVVRAGSTQNISAGVSIDGNATWQSTLIAKQKHTVTLPSNAQRVIVTLSNDNGTSITIAGKKIPYAPNNAYRTITLLIGNAKKSSSHSHSSNGQTNTTNNNSNSNTSTGQSSTQSRSNNTNTTNNTTTQSRHTQSSTTTQSSQSHAQSSQSTQSSTTQSSTTTQHNGGDSNSNGENGNNGN